MEEKKTDISLTEPEMNLYLDYNNHVRTAFLQFTNLKVSEEKRSFMAVECLHQLLRTFKDAAPELLVVVFKMLERENEQSEQNEQGEKNDEVIN